MTKRERMLKDSLEGARSVALRALGGDAASLVMLSEKMNLKSKPELLAFVSAMNLSIETAVLYSRKDSVKHESKWICSEWRSMVNN